MKVQHFEIEGLALIESKVFEDHRGFFTERFRQDRFGSEGLPNSFQQENFSNSKPGVLRGLHYQFSPPQGKLVTCVYGRIFDVAVDIRQNSKTFGQHIAVELSGDTPQWFWIPAGFAHGFCVMGDEPAGVLYKVDVYWSKEGESGIHYADPELKIQWPIKNPLVTDKDEAMEPLSKYSRNPKF